MDNIQSYIKALDEEPNTKSFDITRDWGDVGPTNEAWSEETKAWADMQTIEALFFSEDWVFIVCDLIANKISSNDLRIMVQTTQNGMTSYEYDDNHPLNQLIQNPNSYQDYHSWMYNLVIQFILLGNSINWYSRVNNQIVTLRTAQISIDFYPSGALRNYLYSVESENNPMVRQNQNQAMRFYKNEIIHIRRPNPASLVWGLSPFVAGRKSILFNRYSQDYLNNFYVKQATPGMIIEMDKNVNQQQAIRQLRSFEMAYTGRRNQRRTLMLPQGAKATTVHQSIADQRIVDLINMNRETILAILKVPKHEVGLQTSGSLGSEEYKTALRNFWESTLKPTMRMIEGSLNEFFKFQLGPSHFFRFDLAEVEALQEDQANKAETAAKMLAAGLSVNEVREKVWGEQPITVENADVPFVLARPNQPSFGLPSFPRFDEEEEETQQQPEMEVQESRNGLLKKRVLSLNPNWLDIFHKDTSEMMEGKAFAQMFNVASETLLAITEASEMVIRRMLKEQKSARIPSQRELRRALRTVSMKFEDDYVREFEEVLRTSVDIGYGQQASLVFNSQDRQKLEVLRMRNENRRRLILEARGIRSFSQISETHTERIMKTITQGVERGEAIDQIIQRVATELGDVDQLSKRAQVIARTETLTAASVGAGAALQDAAEIIPNLKKGWLNAGDDRVRDTHVDVGGEVVDHDALFSNGLRWPRDVLADDPGEVIQCRCSLVMLTEGEEVI
jgi:HK97 family phage portal protein